MILTQKHSQWAGLLSAISAEPLAYCPQFPEIAARWEDWWMLRARHPLICACSCLRADIYRGKAFHLLDSPDRWLQSQRLQMENTRWLGEMLPRVRVDIGPEAPAAFLGAPLTISPEEQTAWNTPTIHDWDPPPRFDFEPDNAWYKLVIGLLDYTARDARGRYLVCLPDMGGAVDVLSNMRSPTLLCMDIMDAAREAAKAATMEIADAWALMYEGILDTILGNGAGYINQLGPWSNHPYTVPTCDFNALISVEDFEDFCLPSLRRQAEYAGRVCLHVDGPQAARHADTIGAQGWIDAVQYTPGAGTPSALAKLDMFRSLQDAGKPILVYAPKTEVRELAEKLDSRGLAICTDEEVPPSELAEFEELIKRIQT